MLPQSWDLSGGLCVIEKLAIHGMESKWGQNIPQFTYLI